MSVSWLLMSRVTSVDEDSLAGAFERSSERMAADPSMPNLQPIGIATYGRNTSIPCRKGDVSPVSTTAGVDAAG